MYSYIEFRLCSPELRCDFGEYSPRSLMMVLVFSSTVEVFEKVLTYQSDVYAMASTYWRANRESH